MASTTSATASLPAASLQAGRRGELIAALNGNLATMMDLAAAAKQAHWNVRGPNFQGLHELFDLVAAEARDWGDMLAERAVTLGGTAHGTIQDAAQGSELEPFPTDERGWQPLVRAVHDRMLTSAEQLRQLAKSLDDELATQDICLEIIRGVEKRAWMLDAHFEREGRR